MAIGVTVLGGAACSSGSDSSSGSDNSNAQDRATATSAAPESTETAVPETGQTAAGPPATSTPPEGSGATAPGVTRTTPPPIVPRGSTKANIACRQMFPVVNDAITSWNSANSRDNRSELSASADALKKAADTIPDMAKESEDSQLVTLTQAAADELKKVRDDFAASRDVSGAAVERAVTSLWSYCESTR